MFFFIYSVFFCIYLYFFVMSFNGVASVMIGFLGPYPPSLVDGWSSGTGIVILLFRFLWNQFSYFMSNGMFDG